MKLNVFAILTTLFVVVACSKKDESLHGVWMVERVQLNQASDWQGSPEKYRFEFGTDKSLTVNLDVNTCQTKFESCTCGSMVIDPIGCTEACCDSEFAVQMIEMMKDVDRYDISSEVLVLAGKGKIELKRK
ncbi:MAG: META domain-containing protein [Cryomorphaceae bacterium]|nr:META domain-containing protein [Cryomorphaceae bacterium]